MSRTIRSGLPEILFEVADAPHGAAMEYSLTPWGYTPGDREARDEPASGGEVDLPDFVSILIDGKCVGETTFQVFLMDYAAFHRGCYGKIVTLGSALDDIMERVLGETEEHLADYEDDYDRDDG